MGSPYGERRSVEPEYVDVVESDDVGEMEDGP